MQFPKRVQYADICRFRIDSALRDPLPLCRGALRKSPAVGRKLPGQSSTSPQQRSY